MTRIVYETVESFAIAFAQIAANKLPRASGVEIIAQAFSLPRETAEVMVGEVGKSFNLPAEEAGNTPAQGEE